MSNSSETNGSHFWPISSAEAEFLLGPVKEMNAALENARVLLAKIAAGEITPTKKEPYDSDTRANQS